ncbi:MULTISPECIES: phosphoribosylanthranilate isomerase [Methylophaga]|uniref:N-(5'-phosphoribosyl)anthranilate isomerase n=1 Tax=Methylophaga muralis TaxID=291169 RepID=A0A1E3GUG6_9GAMM|nr:MULTISPECIES: phosphoribosylanthranilate isomerase [Methylophaga]ODN67718.1 N-(5'-phosphoribosyl)anthranilate isomerase [Methylophaga muralis]THK41851.1 phosphoribosylanthranilate isomerase [Methylophaga sp. SB9B]
MRTRVKICGITRRQDAEFAVKSGADAIGLVFYEPSPRAVTAAQAALITAQLPPFVAIVGLFVNASAEMVRQTLEQVPLSLLQFHGDESAEFCEQFNMPYIKAVRMQTAADLTHADMQFSKASALLLDSYQHGVPGGTGQTFDWSMITAISKPLILAGGLTTDNVAAAIKQVSPYAVDVSGGVEESKGLKSNNKISAFMREVANA